MKTKKVFSKTTFNSRLAAYSATAGAALLAAPAHATIQNITTFSYDNGATFVTTAPEQLGAGILAFKTADHQYGFKLDVTNPSYHRVGAKISGGIAAAGYVAFKLGGGVSIAGEPFYAYGWLATRGLFGAAAGHFLPSGPGAAVTGYAGFKDVVGAGHTYYGWMRVKVNNDGSGYPFEVSLVADGNGIFGATDDKNDLTPDAFKVGSVAVAAPEPSVTAIGGLGLLALGAQGVRELRRRRSAQEKV